MCNRAETIFILGHELGHVLAGHTRFHTLASALANLSSGNWWTSILTLGMSHVAIKTLQSTILPPLHAWIRCSELTADRAGYLACQNREAALRALVKLAGYPMSQYRHLNPRSILEQSRLYDEALQNQPLDRVWNALNMWKAKHPQGVVRARELADWVEHGPASEIVAADRDVMAAFARHSAVDPQQYWLMSESAQAVEQYFADRHDLPRSLVGPQVQRLIFAGCESALPALAGILRVELVTDTSHSDAVSHQVVLLLAEQGEIKRVRIPLGQRIPWDDVPARLRNKWLATGTNQITHRLYNARSTHLAHSHARQCVGS
jgi:hypothetical protein